MIPCCANPQLGGGGSAGIASHGRVAARSYFRLKPDSKSESRSNFRWRSFNGSRDFLSPSTKDSREFWKLSSELFTVFISRSTDGMPVGTMGSKVACFDLEL